MKKEINLNHLFIFIFCIFFSIPENSGSIIPSLPIDNLQEVFTLLVVIFSTYKAIKEENKFYIPIFLLLVVKIALILQPTDLWKLCYQDDIAPRAPEEIVQTRDYKFSCEKNYQYNTLEYSTLSEDINFYSSPEYEWLGANNSSFDLSFFNSKKFNHRGDNNLNRKWLPFELAVSKTMDSETTDIYIEFLGDIEVYKNSNLAYKGQSYSIKNKVLISNTKNADIYVYYKFEKIDPVRINISNPINYPQDKYASLQIFDNEMNLLKSKTYITIFSELIFISIFLALMYSYWLNQDLKK